MPERKCGTCAYWARVNRKFGFCEWVLSDAAKGLTLPDSMTTTIKRLMYSEGGTECAAWEADNA